MIVREQIFQYFLWAVCSNLLEIINITFECTCSLGFIVQLLLIYFGVYLEYCVNFAVFRIEINHISVFMFVLLPILLFVCQLHVLYITIILCS